MSDTNKRSWEKFFLLGAQSLTYDELSQLFSAEEPEVGKKLKQCAASYQENMLDLEAEIISSVKKFLMSLNIPYSSARDELLKVDLEKTEAIRVHKSVLSPNKLHDRFSSN